MKTIFNKAKALLYGLLPIGLIAITPLFTACSDDDDDNGGSSSQMVINNVYLEDASAKDSVTDRLVTFARLGQLIRLEGSGFSGLQKIYVNGYDTYFNNALLTDHNIWVTLNSNTPVSTAPDSVRNKITLVKGSQTYTYEFTIRAASPSITSIDNTLPQPGEKVTVYGANLQETTHLTLPGGVEVTDGIESDPDGEWYSFTMPSGVTESGSITSEGANGTAITPAYFNNNSCFIINFDDKGELGSWNATYSSSEYVDDPLNSGRGKVVELVPDSIIQAGGIKAGARSNLWATAGNDNPNDDWNRMTTYIPGSTPVDSVALQFDIYVPEAWNLSGQLEFSLQNNLSNYGYGSGGTEYNADYMTQACVWVPWLNTETGAATAYTTGERWVTVTLPLSSFGRYTNTEIAWTFQNVIDDRNSGSYRNLVFLLVNSDLEFSDDLTYPAQDFTTRVYIDNLRIVPITAFTVSDF